MLVLCYINMFVFVEDAYLDEDSQDASQHDEALEHICPDHSLDASLQRERERMIDYWESITLEVDGEDSQHFVNWFVLYW